MGRLELTQHSVRCPLDDRTASLTVRTDPEGYPASRHREVATCSLLPSTPFVPTARAAYFTDVIPARPFVWELDSTPCHSGTVECAGGCLAILNAAEPGAAEPVRCTSGVSDAMELARRTQNAAVMRVVWFHSA
jgi:hypothetical protein